MDIAAWREATYRRIFENTIQYIHNMRSNDPAFGITELEKMLQSEYDLQGLAWEGRGEVGEIRIEATIAAMQQELIRWKKEETPVNKK
ncbi:MAG: hypothetical protein ACLFPE_06680 [Bacteroidales bacterium]